MLRSIPFRLRHYVAQIVHNQQNEDRNDKGDSNSSANQKILGRTFNGESHNAALFVR